MFNNQYSMNETICAVATKVGGAIAVIRISGPESISITDKVFRGTKNRKLADAKAYTVNYGHIIDKTEEEIDDVLVTVFRAPHSYTGEDSIEISCHGSEYIVKCIIQILIDAGCHQAEPGEYTRRAYLNGKMDLSQAEAVADLIASTNRATHKLALSQLKGHFSSELSVLRNQLLKITSLLELELDFSDHEELEFADRSELKALAKKIDERISNLAHSFVTGNAIKQGIPVAIIGKTNVGKSTLLNRLLHEDKAIVSDIHGTTRDVIEDTTQINGITFRFIDTAGIRQTDDTIEQLGIQRSYQKLEEATIVLWLLDSQPSAEEINDMNTRCQGKRVIVVQNKIDKGEQPLNIASSSLEPSASKEAPTLPLQATIIRLSAKLGTGINELCEALYKAADIPEISENSVIVTSARHYEALTRAQASVLRVIEGMDSELPGDLIAEDLRICLDELGEITGGQITPQETLNNIFKHFCVGK
jgi:tRNA modification GTPase